MTILETERLRVRLFEEADLDAVHAILGDPEVMRYVDDSRPLTREATRGLIETSLRNHRARGYGSGAVVARQDGTLIGYCGFAHSPSCRDVELIYGLGKGHWGRGYGSEVARAMRDHGFRDLGFERIEATVDPENRASVRIIEKLGMSFQRLGVDEHDLPTAFYALDRNPWEMLR